MSSHNIVILYCILVYRTVLHSVVLRPMSPSTKGGSEQFLLADAGIESLSSAWGRRGPRRGGLVGSWDAADFHTEDSHAEIFRVEIYGGLPPCLSLSLSLSRSLSLSIYIYMYMYIYIYIYTHDHIYTHGISPLLHDIGLGLGSN